MLLFRLLSALNPLFLLDLKRLGGSTDCKRGSFVESVVSLNTDGKGNTLGETHSQLSKPFE